jgi:hypothetical protein
MERFLGWVQTQNSPLWLDITGMSLSFLLLVNEMSY